MHFDKITQGIKKHWQVLFGLLCIVLAVIFFAKSGNEIKEVSTAIKRAKLSWIYVGIGLSIVYIVIQGYLYLFSFKTVKTSPCYFSMVILYLKRLLLGVLLPAGGLASLAFTTPEVEEKVSKPKIYFASAIYLFASCTSILLFAVPAILLTDIGGEKSAISPLYLIPIVVIIATIVYLVLSYVHQKWAYHFINNRFPKIHKLMEEVEVQNISLKYLVITFGVSVLLDFTGVMFAYAAMQAITGEGELALAFITYAIVFIIGLISPFMNGLGAIEAALTFLFKKEGYGGGEALLTALIYRFFSFWIPLLYSVFSYIIKRDSIFLKIVPAFFSMVLGFINIITLLFPLILAKEELIQKIINDQLAVVTRFVQFAIGVLMILNSVYLYKGYRKAWIIVVITCCLSIVAHLIANDGWLYVVISAIVLLVLLYTRKHYTISEDTDLMQGLFYFVFMLVFLIIYGALGFYILGREHFEQDVTLNSSFIFSIKAILFFNHFPFMASTSLGKFFIFSIRTGSILCFIYLIILLIRPLLPKSMK